jgi:hypothetical protein
MNLETSKDKESLLKWVMGLLLIMILLYRLGTTTADPDLWGYLAFGRLFWEQGRFPYRDVFAYVPTLDPWIYHEWLTGVLFYPIYLHLGAPGLQVLKYTFGLTTAGLVYLTARKRGATPLAGAMLLFLIAGFLTIGYSAVRAQVFTYLFYAASLDLLESARINGRWRGLWFLVPLQALWCNLHGGFLAGLGLIFVYAAGEALSRRPFWPYLGILALASLATLINPYGLQYWTYLGGAVSMPRPEITEWASLFRAYQTGIISENQFFYILTITAFALFLIWWARWRELTPILNLGLTLYLGLKHYRHAVFFLLLLGAYLPLVLTTYLEELKTRPRVLSACRALGWKLPTLAGAVLILIVGYNFLSLAPLDLKTPPVPESGSKTEVYYPVGAVAYIKEHGLAGKVLLEFNWGEYFIWNLYPQCRVAIDGRYETVYPPAVNHEYFEFIFGRPKWRQFLTQYPPDLILVTSRSRICRLLQDDPQWRQAYSDTGCALFRRGDR